jgi:flagellar basal body-associated protein FliL
MWTLIKIVVVVAILGGVTYYFMDYNDKEESSIIESTKEFSKDVVNKTINETKELKENVAEAADSSETLQNMREDLKN